MHSLRKTVQKDTEDELGLCLPARGGDNCETSSCQVWARRRRAVAAGTCFLSAKTPDVSNSPRLLIDTADPTQTHLVDLASIVECQPAAAPRRGVSQADVYNLLKRMSARTELPVGQ
ncbi:hypothetical protein ISCGN_001764 [Ixodes scapularis]